MTDTTLPPHWVKPHTPGSYAIPKDDLGFGRGLMQADWCSNYDWCQELMPDGITFKWQDPLENIKKAALIFNDCLKAFPTNKKAAFASYNAGVNNAQKGISLHNDSDFFTTKRHNPDGTTTGYGECCLGHKAKWPMS